MTAAASTKAKTPSSALGKPTASAAAASTEAKTPSSALGKPTASAAAASTKAKTPSSALGKPTASAAVALPATAAAEAAKGSDDGAIKGVVSERIGTGCVGFVLSPPPASLDAGVDVRHEARRRTDKYVMKIDRR